MKAATNDKVVCYEGIDFQTKERQGRQLVKWMVLFKALVLK